METIPHHPLLVVTQEDLKKAREFYGLKDTKTIKESLATIEEWVQKQDHLAEAFKHLNVSLLERFFILARGSVEGTKAKIDKMFTARGMMPELSMHRTVEEFDKFFDVMSYTPLPKLFHSDQSRVMVTRFLTPKLDDFSLLSYFRFCFMLGEYRLHYDYSVSERYIIDLSNLHMGHLSKINPVLLKKAEVLCTEGYGTKIKGIHIMNAPNFVDKLIFLLKQALKEKVARRIHVHPTCEDLHKHIPRDILPKDYEGDADSCDKLSAKWKEALHTEEARKIIKESDYLVSDESRRQSLKFNEEYLGMPGSFRKLNVD